MATRKQKRYKQSQTPITSYGVEDFDPLKLIESSINSNFDPNVVNEIDERQLPWCKNITSWLIDPEFCGVQTIFPLQLQVLLKLFGDVCPWCSDWEFYSRDWPVDLKIGNALDRLTFLNDGKCPKCGKTKLDAYREGYWIFPHEMDLLWGMRCKEAESLVFSNRGLIKFKNVNVGDKLTHGIATKKFDSGTLQSLSATTDMNWTLSGSKQSHIVPILNQSLDLEYKLLNECKIGEHLVLCSPDLWAQEKYSLPEFENERIIFPTEVTADLARLVGYLVSNGSYTEKSDHLQVASSDPDTTNDIKRCCISLFGIEPTITQYANTPHCYRISFGCGLIKKWLHFIGLHPATAHNKVIPDFILRSPKEIVCEFLAGLFGGDGGLYVETVGHRKKVLLYYTTVSKTLVEQVRLLLLNMGIVTNLSKFVSNGFKKANTYIKDVNQEGKDKYSYRLATKCSKFIEIFRDNVRLVSKNKLDALTQLSSKGRIRYHTPLGSFQLNTKRCPKKITELAKQGYFFVKIKSIKDGPSVPMMDVHIPDTNIYTADGFVHHNSGKSAIAGMAASYILHRYIKIPDPAKYFGLLKGSLLVMRFVALTAGQASETIWGQFTRAVDNCAWFGTYHDFLRQYEKKLGMELQKWLSTVFHYPLKGITGYFLGASIDTSRGRTSILTVFDEIGWWLGGEKAKRANAEETYAAYEKASRTIRNASMTRFLERNEYNVPTSWLMAVSSTSSKSDYIMHLIRQAKADKKKVSSHKASWEVNPEFARNPDELKNERENNYKVYMRDYGSVPPYANDPFFDNEDLVVKAATLPIPQWSVTQETGKIGEYLNAAKVEKSQSVPYCLCMDLAHNHCGLGVALLKLKETDFSVVQIAGLFSIYPLRHQVIDLSQTYDQFIKPLCEKINIKLVLYDQWQSKTQIQSLLNLGIASQEYSLTTPDFERFRTQLMQGKIEFIQPEYPLDKIETAAETLEDILYTRPYVHFLWQLLSISQIGNKIGKGEGHDDLIRSVALGASFLWNEDWRGQFEYKPGFNIVNRQKKGRLVIAGGSLSTGQLYSVGTSTNTNPVSVSQGKRALGSVITRGGGG